MVSVICVVVVMMVSMAIVITVYAVVMLGWCSSGLLRLPDPSLAPAEPTSLGQAQWSPYLRCKFKYTKGIENPEVGSEESEEPCAVCLSGFEEGQNACQLPKCNHSFHSTCIDTWLYSHADCPVCRSPVDRVICWIRDPAMVPGKFC